MSDTDLNNTPVTENTEIEVNMYVYTNRAPDAPAESLLRLFYEGTLTNSIGAMRAKNTKTGEEELLLVGIYFKEDGSSETFPLARVLNADDAAAYVSPDGKGGWFEPMIEVPEQPAE